MDGRVVVLDGPTGRVLRTLIEGAPVFCPATNPNCNPRGLFGTPAIGDIDGDGKPDIVASSYDHTLYAWKADGQPIFRLFVQDTVWSSPVIADIDGDRKPEVIVGGDIYPNNPLGVPAGGLVWAFTRASGKWAVYPRYPKSIPGQTVWSTPAVADLNGDGHPDVVVGTGNDYPISAAGQKVYAFDARSTLNLPGWPVSTVGQVSNGPAVADVLGNHQPEAVFASEG